MSRRLGAPLHVTLTDTGRRQIKMIKPLGKGGFGAVYLADVITPEGLVHRMAVKVLHEEFANDQAIAARARDEARLMSQLNHDHVVKVHALTRIGGRAAVLMEYVEGIDCTALLAASAAAGGKGLPLSVSGAVIERAASALHAAWHTVSPQTGQPLKVVHRDIKPSNLLVSVAGAVKVMDFGVARGDFEREAATESVQYGTHRYMAPERWLYGHSGPESDIYSLGVTFWELLTGDRFERLPLVESSFITRREAQLDPLAALPQLDPKTAPQVRALLIDMLAFEPEQRIAAHQVEDRMASLLESSGGPTLRRYARGVIPPLVRNRERKLADDSELNQLTNSLAFPTGRPPPPSVVGDPSAATRPSTLTTVGATLLTMLVVAGLGGGAAYLALGPGGEPVAMGEPSVGELPELPPGEPVPGGGEQIGVGGPATPSGNEQEPEAGVPGAAPAGSEPGGSVPSATPKGGSQTTPKGPRVTPSKPPPEEPPEEPPAAEPVKPQVQVTEKVTAPPPPPKVSVTLMSDPAFDSATVAGQEVSRMFGKAMVSPGTHTIKFIMKDGSEHTCTVEVPARDSKIKFVEQVQRCTAS